MPVTKIQLLLLTAFLKRNEGKMITKPELIYRLFEDIRLDCPKYAQTAVILSFVKNGKMTQYTTHQYYIKKYKSITSSVLRKIINEGIEMERKKHRIFAK